MEPLATTLQARTQSKRTRWLLPLNTEPSPQTPPTTHSQGLSQNWKGQEIPQHHLDYVVTKLQTTYPEWTLGMTRIMAMNSKFPVVQWTWGLMHGGKDRELPCCFSFPGMWWGGLIALTYIHILYPYP